MSHDQNILLNEILQDLTQIKKKFNIVPDKEGKIDDFEASIETYEVFELDELKLEQTTIDNQKSSIRNYLNFSNGNITKETVTQYLDSNESDSWKSNQLKALRRYTRNFLKLGNWTEDFHFRAGNNIPKIKQLPTDDQLITFLNKLPTAEIRIIFLMLLNSGLRIGEVLSLRIKDVEFWDYSIDATQIHKGQTKHSWFSFFTEQTAEFLAEYVKNTHQLDSEDYSDNNYRIDSDLLLFTVSKRTVQQSFQRVSKELDFEINPHLLRSVFTNRCTKSGIKDKYIDAFCGRTSKGVLAKHYTAYSVDSLKEEYEKVEELFTLGK